MHRPLQSTKKPHNTANADRELVPRCSAASDCPIGLAICCQRGPSLLCSLPKAARVESSSHRHASAAKDRERRVLPLCPAQMSEAQPSRIGGDFPNAPYAIPRSGQYCSGKGQLRTLLAPGCSPFEFAYVPKSRWKICSILPVSESRKQEKNSKINDQPAADDCSQTCYSQKCHPVLSFLPRPTASKDDQKTLLPVLHAFDLCWLLLRDQIPLFNRRLCFRSLGFTSASPSQKLFHRDGTSGNNSTSAFGMHTREAKEAVEREQSLRSPAGPSRVARSPLCAELGPVAGRPCVVKVNKETPSKSSS